jgi:hypothetical protein
MGNRQHRTEPDLLLARTMRTAAWMTAALLLIGYATGEEFQHTHALLGYGFAAVLTATICWELIMRQHRPTGVSTEMSAANAAFNRPSSWHIGGPHINRLCTDGHCRMSRVDRTRVVIVGSSQQVLTMFQAPEERAR